MMKDLIINAISNYTPDKIKVYIESLSKTTFSGDKIMICYNLPLETISYLRDNGWECYEGELKGHPHMQRLIDIWYFLSQDNRVWEHIITTDVRDIYWQIDPSMWLEKNLKNEILVASEYVKYEDEEWGKKNIHEGYGEIFWEYVKDKTIGNVGVLAGKYESVKNLLMLNWLVSQAGNTDHFTDQSSLNLIINNSLIKDKIDLNSEFALQCGTKNFKVDIKENLIVDNDENLPYVLIHQYDRIKYINDFLMNK